LHVEQIKGSAREFVELLNLMGILGNWVLG